MFSSHRHIIPPELLLKIFHVSDRETLSMLLTVSRSINELATPLLYEDVRLLAPLEPQTSYARERTPSFQSIMDCFSASVSANGGRLGACVKRLHLRVPFARQTESEWCRILTLCPNLAYLDLSTTFELDLRNPLDASILYSLGGSLRLTHLCLGIIPSSISFNAFLESQYTLESLSITHIAGGGFSLSPDALPNLVYLSGPWSILAALIPGRRVAHLEIDDFLHTIDVDQISLSIAQGLNNIQSLCVDIDWDAQQVTILPKFQNLEYTKIVYFPPLGLLQFLTQLSSTQLRYLQIGCMGSMADQDLNWTVFFKMFPSLRLLDVHPSSNYDNPWYRYRFDDLDSRPKEVDFDCDVWRWWHGIKQDVEDALLQSGSGM